MVQQLSHLPAAMEVPGSIPGWATQNFQMAFMSKISASLSLACDIKPEGTLYTVFYADTVQPIKFSECQCPSSVALTLTTFCNAKEQAFAAQQSWGEQLSATDSISLESFMGCTVQVKDPTWELRVPCVDSQPYHFIITSASGSCSYKLIKLQSQQH